MKYSLTLCVLAILALPGCKPGYKEAANGTLYINYTNIEGAKIKPGDFVCINQIIRTDADSTITNTFEKGIPTLMILSNHVFNGDIIDALSLASEGDSLSVKMPVDSVFKKAKRPANFKGNFIIADLKVEKVISKSNMTDSVLRNEAIKYMKQLLAKRKWAEPASIKKYITDKKLSVSRTDSGLYYAIMKKGNGSLIKAGDTAVMNYMGYLFNGKVFNTNIAGFARKANIYKSTEQYKPFKIPVTGSHTMPGLSQSLQLLNKGAMGEFIIPSALAYGDMDSGFAGPYTPLVFKIWIVDIIHPAQPAK